MNIALISSLACLAPQGISPMTPNVSYPPTPPAPVLEVQLVSAVYFGSGYESKFLATTMPVTASAGDESAAKIGCNLAEIDSPIKNAFVSEIGLNLTGGWQMQNPWIALRRYTQPGTFSYSLPFPPPLVGAWIEPNLRAATYTNFAPGEPNNNGGNETRVAINEHAPGLWNDLPESAKRSALIEVELSPSFSINGYQNVTNVITQQLVTLVTGKSPSMAEVQVFALDAELDPISETSCQADASGIWSTPVLIRNAKFIFANIADGSPGMKVSPQGVTTEHDIVPLDSNVVPQYFSPTINNADNEQTTNGSGVIDASKIPETAFASALGRHHPLSGFRIDGYQYLGDFGGAGTPNARTAVMLSGTALSNETVYVYTVDDTKDLKSQGRCIADPNGEWHINVPLLRDEYILAYTTGQHADSTASVELTNISPDIIKVHPPLSGTD